MRFFRNFTLPLWEIFSGNLLVFIASAFYIAWWAVSFYPNVENKTAWPGFFIAITLFAGVAGIVIMSIGINSLSGLGKGFPVIYILMGAAAFFIILLGVTKIAFHRAVTSELLLITLWAALQLSAIVVLQVSGRFDMGRTITLTALVALATVTGIVCYILHYRLDEIPRFWNGLIPLIVDAGVVLVFLPVLALS